MQLQNVPTLDALPRGLQRDGAISIELEDGVPIFRASLAAQNHIEDLLHKQKLGSLTPDEQHELRQYEDVDDYLSYLNRLTRNLAAASKAEENRVA